MRRGVKSGRNVFLALGFAPEEAAVLKMRADLMGDLREHIRESNLTQAQVARRLGITQSRVSDLVRGKWQKFDLETLITLSARLGRRVVLRVVRRAPKPRYRLADLVKRITPRNVHREVDWGVRVGGEVV